MTVGSDDLAFLHRVADAADAVSRAHFRSEELRRLYKDDGTPVAEVDRGVEEAMLALVRGRADDAVLGEEVGAHAGTTSRRWIFDGIDGTHNYADGRPGWGTIIALEEDGELVLGAVTAPLWGRRYWASKGGGAWCAPYSPDGALDVSAATQLQCRTGADIDNAAVIVVPWFGLLLGWRNAVPRLFEQPAEPRSQCFALDALAVAEGTVDATVIVFGGVWDFAATSLIVREAGGVFRDAWGGTRFDTSSGVYTTAGLLDGVLARVSTLRPDVPDRPKLARTVSTPIGTPEEQAVDGWRVFGVRPQAPMSARTPVTQAPGPVMAIVDERAACLAAPLTGVTTDGIVRPIAHSALGRAVDTRPIADAALTFLQSLPSDFRARARFPMDAQEWRMWINVHMNHFRHGVMLEDLPQRSRDAALGILRTTMSARGYEQARSIMRINQLLADITGHHDQFGEWPYFVSIFGEPGGGEPWGWQIDGHHLCVNTVVFEDRIVMTPTFMGSEPRSVNFGPYAGLSLFDPEESLGLDLIRALDDAQRARAIIYPSIHPDDIHPSLQNAFDGRMQAGAFHDNVVLPSQGVPGGDMTDAQRKVLLSLAGTYVGWAGDAHAEVRMNDVVAHLDETWFSWYGGYGESEPFYYRVHSPVLLVEFDHHPGVGLDNEIPTRHHVHTVVRTPNGGDYGADLLRQHHEQYDHRRGSHDAHGAVDHESRDHEPHHHGDGNFDHQH